MRDGMDVINLSLGEPDIEPTRDILARALNAAADAGVVSGRRSRQPSGSSASARSTRPGASARRSRLRRRRAARQHRDGHGVDFSSLGPAPYSLRFKPDVTAPGDDVASSVPGGGYADAERDEHGRAARRRRGGSPRAAAPDVDAGAGQVRARAHRCAGPQLIGHEVSPLREGGGRIDLPRADHAARVRSADERRLRPASVRERPRRERSLCADAGGGAGMWTVTLSTAGCVRS